MDFLPTGFIKILIKFHENPSSVIRDVPCGRTDGQTDLMKRLKYVIVDC